MGPPTPTAGGIVLCGGRSSRMGQPKYTLPFDGEPLLLRIVQIVGQVVSPVVVVAAEHQPIPELPPGVRVVRDEQPDLGPLAALAGGLAALDGQVDCAYLSSCDVPLLQPAFVQRMLSLLGGHELVLPQEEQFYHPLAGVYRTRLLPTIRRLIQAGKLRPAYLLEECNSRTVNVEGLRDVDPDLLSLRNTNTPEEFAAVVELHARLSGD